MLLLLAGLAHADPVLVDLSGYPGTWLLGDEIHDGTQVVDLAPGRHQLGLVVGVWVDVAEDGRVTVESPGMVATDGHAITVAAAGLTRAKVTPLACTPVAMPLPMPDAVAAAPVIEAPPIARLSVFMTGTAWADVWVDGARLPKPAPLRDYQLPPGSHEIRVSNAQAGIESSEIHDFAAGETVVLRTRVP